MDTVEKNLRILSVEQDLEEIASDRVATYPPPALALVSVVIPCFGQLEYTRLCVPSLFRHSRQPLELIFVDVGSLDGTPEYLAGLQTASSFRVEVIQTDEESGSAAAFDIGIAQAKGKFIVLLNNDTIVTEGWLNQLTALAALDPKIGAVGPMSNYASRPQWVGTIPYRIRPRAGAANVPEVALDQFANDWRERHKGKWFETDLLDTFCILFKREALERIGPLARLSSSSAPRRELKTLDESGLGAAIRRTGAKMACCHDLLVHHFGSRLSISAAPEMAKPLI